MGDQQPTTRKGILVSDFDGTMTRRDFYQLVRERWWQDAKEDPWQDYLAGRLTHFEALARFFAGIRTDEAGLRHLAEEMEIDPDLAGAVARLQHAGWEIVIASAGCDYYIRYLLQRAGVSLPVHANPGSFDPALGLHMRLPVQSPFFSPTIGIDKSAVLRDALSRGKQIAYAGDGPPDLEPALLVPGHLRFARGWLAERLQTIGEPFQPFERWTEIGGYLTRQGKA